MHRKNGSGFLRSVVIPVIIAVSFMTNIVIIGRRGYIGGAIVKYLSSEGSYNIVAPSSAKCNFLNLEEVKSFFSTLGFEECHVVFTAVINKSINDSMQTFLQNIQIISNFVEGQEKANISSIIFLSSVDVYGKDFSAPITEETSINPDNWYGLSKYVSEWILASNGKIECPLTILRLPGVFGKAPKENSVIGNLVQNIEENRKVILTGNGEALRDYVFVNDVAAIIESFILNSHPGIFNLATGTKYSIKNIVEIIRNTLKTDFEIVYEHGYGCRMFDIFFNNHKLTKALPDFRFRGIEAGIESYRN